MVLWDGQQGSEVTSGGAKAMEHGCTSKAVCGPVDDIVRNCLGGFTAAWACGRVLCANFVKMRSQGDVTGYELRDEAGMFAGHSGERALERREEDVREYEVPHIVVESKSQTELDCQSAFAGCMLLQRYISSPYLDLWNSIQNQTLPTKLTLFCFQKFYSNPTSIPHLLLSRHYEYWAEFSYWEVVSSVGSAIASSGNNSRSMLPF